jgi:hypothetical protein
MPSVPGVSRLLGDRRTTPRARAGTCGLRQRWTKSAVLRQVVDALARKEEPTACVIAPEYPWL